VTIKLIAIDIDGTLLNNDHRITPETRATIQAALTADIKVVLCSGRPLTGVTPFLKELGISGDDQYAITFNGSMAQTITGKVLVQHALSYTDYIDLEAWARKQAVHFQVETPQRLYTANPDLSWETVVESHLVHLPIGVRTLDEMPTDLTMPTAMFIDEESVIDRVMTAIPQEFHDRFYVVRTSPKFIEVMNQHASKGKTLHELATRLRIRADEIMAIGDQGNDLPMIRYAGFGIAMGNASEPVKAAANHITLSNTENGVAAAIKQYALNYSKE